MDTKAKEPLVSIIIPAYNVGKYIQQCINSVQNQDYTNIEIIVINDGSTDNTSDIVDYISSLDKRVILVNNTNQGVSASRNHGIEIANGEWIGFLDGDDYLESTFISHMLEIALKTGSNYCLTTACFMTKKDVPPSSIDIKKCTSDEATALLLSPKVEVGCWNKLFKASLLKESGIRFNTSLFYGEGLFFITSLSQIAECVGVSNNKVYYYRQDNFLSATKKFNIEKIENGWKALDLIEAQLLSGMPKSKRMLSLHRCLFSFNAVRKIEASRTKQNYHDIYKFHLGNVRRSLFRELFSRSIDLKFKIKLLICAVLPILIGVMGRRNVINRGKISV